MFTNQLGLCNSLTTLEIIGDSFDVSDPGKLSWIISGYGLTLGTFVLIGGRLGDEFGNKAIFIIGMGWLALTSMMAGVSVYSSYPVYVLARVLQGLGPALTVPNALAIMGKCFSEGPRNMGFAWFAASAPVGAMAGLLFGPLFAMAWWPWIYWSQALGVAFLVIIAIFAIPNMPVEGEKKQRRTIRETLDRLDLLGGASGVIALVLFNFAWNQSLVTTWDEPYVYVCLILSLLFLAAFSYIELRLARYPILPVAVLTSDIAFVFGCTAAGWSTFGIWVGADLLPRKYIKLRMFLAFLRPQNIPQYRRPNSHSTGCMAFSYPRHRHINSIDCWKGNQQGSSFVHHVVCNALLLSHFASNGLATCTFDVLDLFLFRDHHRHLCNGLIVACCHDHLRECSASTVPGYGIQCDHDDCCLQHIARSWFRWYH
jgi:MFS family permease